ncbi:hypothetical protein AGMMS49991_06490 [Spirochaetia bacterium]|nr:hypothetical protein AGMMS49991_06490 [Spirochaetia bacterium]
MKIRILVGILVLTLVIGNAAALDTKFTIDLDSELFKVDYSGEDETTTFSSIDGTSGSEWNYDNSELDWVLSDDKGRFGGRIRLNITSALAPSLDNTFNNIEAWVMLGDYLRITGGRITSNPTARLNSIIDDLHLGQHLGPMVGTQTVWNLFRTDHLIWDGSSPTTGVYVGNESRYQYDKLGLGGRNLEWMADFYPGKFLGKDITLSAALFDTLSAIIDKDKNSDNGDGQIIGGVGARVSGKFSDAVKVNLTYRYQRLTPTEGIKEYISSNTHMYRNNVGLYAELNLLKGLDIVAGYGGSFGYTPYTDETTIVQLKRLKDFSDSSDMFNGIDLRVQFSGISGITLVSHNNVSFGEDMVRAVYDTTGPLNGKDYEYGWQYFGLYNAIGLRFALTGALNLDLVVSNWFDRITDVNKSDGSGDDVVTSTDKLVAGPALRWAVTPYAEFRFALQFAGKFTNFDGEQYKPDLAFSIPVGITLKF